MKKNGSAALDLSLRKLIAAAPSGEDWWLIGSAAAYLCGIELEPHDVDVVASQATVETLAHALGGIPVAEPSALFRSTPFVRVYVPDGLPIELMGDLQVHATDWTPLRLTTRVAIETPSGTIYVPSLDEQTAIFEQFGRPKDLAKAAILRRRRYR